MHKFFPGFLTIIIVACDAQQGSNSIAAIPVSEHTVETDDGTTLYYRIAGAGAKTVMAMAEFLDGGWPEGAVDIP